MKYFRENVSWNTFTAKSRRIQVIHISRKYFTVVFVVVVVVVGGGGGGVGYLQ